MLIRQHVATFLFVKLDTDLTNTTDLYMKRVKITVLTTTEYQISINECRM
jgi:hypothetical protein